MTKTNKNIKRAVILFVKNEKQKNSKTFSIPETYDFFNEQLKELLTNARKKIEFDIIPSAGSIKGVRTELVLVQSGKSFGEKFDNAITNTFERGYDEIVIIGNDSPELSAGHIIETFKNIGNGNVVLGPSSDGGIYLLGLNKRQYKKTVNIRWNSSYVMSDLPGIFNHETKVILSYLTDIDNESDLRIWLSLLSDKARIYRNKFFIRKNSVKRSINYDRYCTEQNNFRIHTQKAPPVYLHL